MNSVCELCSKPIYPGDGSYGACNECVKIHISNAIKDKKSYESIHLRHKDEFNYKFRCYSAK